MRIWLITIGEPLPTDAGAPRLMRTGIIAGLLRDRGHEVVWWTSRFDHQAKTMRAPLSPDSKSKLGYELRLLAGCGYASNVSLDRIRDHHQVAQAFLAEAGTLPAPQVVLCSYPTVGLCEAALSFSQPRGIPIAMDLRDLWPDIFVNLVPRPLHRLARMLLRPMFQASNRACAGATALYGITEAFVDWGVARAGRSRRDVDRAFPLAYDLNPIASEALGWARDQWTSLGIGPDARTLCFFGTLGRQFDIPTVLRAARILKDDDLRLVICGVGDRLDLYRREAADLPKVLFPGWVDSAAIRALMERSLAGLAPYHNERSFTMSIPNKAVEYLAGGLPVLTCLTGKLQQLLNDQACGLFWSEGDADGLVAAIRALTSDAGARQHMADNAASAYSENFVAQVVYGRLIDHLCDLAAAPRAGARAAKGLDLNLLPTP